jgi:hypothetical protein
MLMRAEAAVNDNQERLREALAIFESIGCRHQAARTGWFLGGSERERASAVFEDLRIPPPAEV